MRLQEIEISGFKSFARRVRLRFDREVTGIVGPNGCGKSNFVDAMRWVLGEQRMRILRSQRVHELIFNGTAQRKALHMAEVSLLLERTKGTLATQSSVVQLSRRVYRSGESEYAINGVPSRLKDLVSLTLDTGLSAEAYSIIELKMIEDILSDREGTRLQLIEQAAGIAKFKKQRKEALAKLGHTENDLVRIEDMLNELSRNMRVLEKQAARANQQTKLREKYEILRLAEVALANEGVDKRLGELNKQHKEQKDVCLKLRTRLRQAEAFQVKLRRDYDVQEKAFGQVGRDVAEKQQQRQRLEKELEVSRVQATHLEAKCERHQQQITAQQKRKKEVLAHKETLEKKEQGLMQRFSDALLGLESAQKKRAAAELAVRQALRRHAQEQQRKTKAEESLQGCNQQLTRKETLYETVVEQRKTTETLQQEQIRKTKDLESVATQLSAQLEERLGEKAGKEKIMLSERSAEEVAKKAEEEARLALNGEHQRLKSLQERKEWLGELKKRMTGLPSALRWLQSQPSFRSPLLVEVLAPQAPYVAAISTYLSAYSNYFVVQSPAEAKHAFDLLKHRNEPGICHCFVLEELKGHASSFYGKPLPSAYLWARDQVRCQPAYEALRDFLLDGVVLSPEDALVHSLEGLPTCIAQDGSWARSLALCWGGKGGQKEDGGQHIESWGLTERLLDVEKEIKKTQEILETRQQEHQEAQAQVEVQLRKASASHALEVLGEEISRLQREQEANKAWVENHYRLHQEAVHRGEELVLEETKLADEKHKLLEQIGILKIEHETLVVVTKTTAASLEQARESHDLQSEVHHKASLAHQDMEKSLQQLKAERSLHESYLNEHQKTLGDEEEALQTTEAMRKALVENEKVLQAQLIKESKAYESASDSLQASEGTYLELRRELQQADKTLEGHRKEEVQAQFLFQELATACQRLETEKQQLKETLKAELDTSYEALCKKYEKAIASEVATLSADESRRQAHPQRLAKLKEELSLLGAVNPMAVEGLAEIKSRHQFIQKEQNDVLRARAVLQKTLQEIEKSVKERFMKAFSAVNTHFQDIFCQLFSADDFCELRLKEEQVPEQSGIDIVARPKGKRPLHIEQLSSGEKALTALALLVALYLYKPSPFCILDEVDAPLDDANTAKFNQLISTLSQKAQFILITHNKYTMQHCEVLYGLSMPEKGVTRVLPVDMAVLEDASLPR